MSASSMEHVSVSLINSSNIPTRKQYRWVPSHRLWLVLLLVILAYAASLVLYENVPKSSSSGTGKTKTYGVSASGNRSGGPGAVDQADRRTTRPLPEFKNIMEQYEQGEFIPEEPDRLPGLRVHHRTFSPSELLERFSNSTFIYTFVNGTELNYVYHKYHLAYCVDHAVETELRNYILVTTGEEEEGAVQPKNVCNTTHLPSLPHTVDSARLRKLLPYLKSRECNFMLLKQSRPTTARELLQDLQNAVHVDVQDREVGELRHSVRSMEKNIQWHNGRLVMVSPGHHPQWMDSARNFLAGSCGGHAVTALQLTGTHIRATTVHQDAILPYGVRVTRNTHVIEQHLWRLKNVTPVHLFWNDDYFVNRNVAITDLFTEHGGTVVRTEKGILQQGVRATQSEADWRRGVFHTHLFNIRELDILHEDVLPQELHELWRLRHITHAAQVGRKDGDGLCSASRHQFPANATLFSIEPQLDILIDTAAMSTPPPLPNMLQPRRHRRFVTHAPFAYCTHMFRFLATRYEREFARNGLMHRLRRSQDLYMPFVYNAFIMARPWAASPQYLPYLLQLKASREDGSHTSKVPSVDIMMDNVDGCAPTELRGGYIASECVFTRFVDNMTKNKEAISAVNAMNPLFFNTNSEFTTEEVAEQLRSFLHAKFPEPVYLERGGSVVAGEQDGALEELYRALMRLPVVAVTSFAEGVCPLLRSLQLSLADHTGVVVPVTVPLEHPGINNRTLAELRVDLRHRVRTALPVVQCAFNKRVVHFSGTPWVNGNLSVSIAAILSELRRNATGNEGTVEGVLLPTRCHVQGGRSSRIVAIVLDGRAEDVAVHDARWLRHAVAMPGQTLALEDFEVVPVGAGGDAVLLLSRASAAARGVEWIDGAAETDLLTTYPIPHAAYEDLDAPLQML